MQNNWATTGWEIDSILQGLEGNENQDRVVEEEEHPEKVAEEEIQNIVKESNKRKVNIP